MKTIAFTEQPIEICGLEVIDPEQQNYWRLKDEDTALVSPGVRDRSKTTAGGRVRFRTDSKNITARIELKTLSVDACIPICGSAGGEIMSGTGLHSKYIGLINPRTYDNFAPEFSFTADGTMQQYTIYLPRNEQITGVWITIDDDARVLAPLPYSRPGKLCFYGSSITEGGCCTRPGNSYVATLARWLDMDFANWGFSGLARGEDAMADIICAHDFSAFIYDYDHNAPDAAHLTATHERFFKKVRAAHPEMPVIMLTKPDYDGDPINNAARREIIRRTYENAVAAGDENVYFVDGESFFGDLGREMCTVDGCHPNDLGFFLMAKRLFTLLTDIL